MSEGVTLYVDVLFAINFSMDFVSLFLCGKLLHKRIPKLRLIVASVVGGLYGVLSLLLNVSLVVEIIICVAVSLIMCTIVFFEKNIRAVSVSIIVFWIISSLLGGVMSFLYTLANKLLAEYINSYTYEVVYSGARFFVIASVTILITSFFCRIFFNNKDKKTVKIIVIYKNKEFALNGLCDSGNMLRDPLSNKCVILVCFECTLAKEIIKEEEIHKRFIPYTDISGSGILKGVIPTKIIIENKEVSAVVAPASQKALMEMRRLYPLP
ncbi:MAG: sigma-E processing peptidase SpoIIGA [Clostridia bacterium]|nr:sigma-E processing peptidase SpoIIGA [Clostridia bacterium]